MRLFELSDEWRGEREANEGEEVDEVAIHQEHAQPNVRYLLFHQCFPGQSAVDASKVPSVPSWPKTDEMQEHARIRDLVRGNDVAYIDCCRLQT